MDIAKLPLGQPAGPSEVYGAHYDGSTTETLSDVDIPPGMAYDDLHPPSPKVPKGGKVKSTSAAPVSIILQRNEEESSSDIDMQLLGRVASGMSGKSGPTENEPTVQFGK